MRSNVTIMCEQKAYELFKEAWKKADFRSHRVYRSGKDGNYHYTLCYKWVKWYCDGAKAIIHAMDMLDMHEDEDGYAYKLIEVDEAYETDIIENAGGCSEFKDEDFGDFGDFLFCGGNVDLPADNVEINE